jgi:adenosylmethionine-8-amino-7-oxononanoate aminotransferase
MVVVKQRCRDAGLLVSISNHMVILTPPLVITAAEVDLLVTRLERGVRAAIDARPLSPTDLTTVGAD